MPRLEIQRIGFVHLNPVGLWVWLHSIYNLLGYLAWDSVTAADKIYLIFSFFSNQSVFNTYQGIYL